VYGIVVVVVMNRKNEGFSRVVNLGRDRACGISTNQLFYECAVILAPKA